MKNFTLFLSLLTKLKINSRLILSKPSSALKTLLGRSCKINFFKKYIMRQLINFISVT